MYLEHLNILNTMNMLKSFRSPVHLFELKYYLFTLDIRNPQTSGSLDFSRSHWVWDNEAWLYGNVVQYCLHIQQIWIIWYAGANVLFMIKVGTNKSSWCWTGALTLWFKVCISQTYNAVVCQYQRDLIIFHFKAEIHLLLYLFLIFNLKFCFCTVADLFFPFLFHIPLLNTCTSQ
jgi:hypothetical protein